MAKGKGEIKGWITRNGVHIPIYGTYTVRGGVEPTAKGSKFKRKKRPEEFDKDIRESGGKYWVAHSSAQGKKQGVKDLDKPFDTKEEARAFLAKENGEYEDAKFDKKAELGQEKDKKPDRDEVRKSNHENMLAVKERIREKEAMEERKEKYANRDWNKDVDDAKRYGYSEQSETGKKPVTKAEEQGKTIEVNGRKINVKPGENNAQAIYRTAMEEQGKPVDKEFYDSQRVDYGETGTNRETSRGQESSTPDMRDETKTLGDGGKVTPRIKAQEQAYVDDAFKPQVSEKERKMQELRDAERAYVNEAFEGNTKQESSRPDFSKMSYSQAGDYISKNKASFGLTDNDDPYQVAYQLKEGNWSVGSDGKIKSEHLEEQRAWDKKMNERTMARRREFQAEQASSTPDLHSRIQAQAEQADVHRQRTSVKKVPSPRNNTSESKYGHAWMEKESQAIYGKSYSELSNNDKYNIANRAYQAEERAARRAEKKAAKAESSGSKASIPTTVSGLRSAYAEATGSEKAKISAELRRKGYSLVGGKWVKGK